jgi:molybdopterin converting factor subunit 1
LKAEAEWVRLPPGPSPRQADPETREAPTTAVRITVQLFALAREKAGAPSVALDLDADATVADLRRALAAATPAIAPLVPSLLIAIDSQYARDDTPIPPTAEIAAFPPVSGG